MSNPCSYPAVKETHGFNPHSAWVCSCQALAESDARSAADVHKKLGAAQYLGGSQKLLQRVETLNCKLLKIVPLTNPLTLLKPSVSDG